MKCQDLKLGMSYLILCMWILQGPPSLFASPRLFHISIEMAYTRLLPSHLGSSENPLSTVFSGGMQDMILPHPLSYRSASMQGGHLMPICSNTSTHPRPQGDSGVLLLSWQAAVGNETQLLLHLDSPIFICCGCCWW